MPDRKPRNLERTPTAIERDFWYPKPVEDVYKGLASYLEPTVRPLVGQKTIQLLLLRESLDYLVLRTEETREINDVTTPSVRAGAPVRRVAFLGSKQKAVESRELERLLRTASETAKFDQRGAQGGRDCYLKDQLCLRCPRCGLFGGTNVESGKGDAPNIKHRVEYGTAFSLLPYDEVVEDVTFNAIDERGQITGQALGTRSCVRPGTLFASVVALRCATPVELALTVKALLSARSYGAESRTQGSVRNHIVGLVAGWEEVITALEFALACEEKADQLVNPSTRPAIVRALIDEYRGYAANPGSVRLWTEDGKASVGADRESRHSPEMARDRGDAGVVEQGADGYTEPGKLSALLETTRQLVMDEPFLNRAYRDVQDLREAQGAK